MSSVVLVFHECETHVECLRPVPEIAFGDVIEVHCVAHSVQEGEGLLVFRKFFRAIVGIGYQITVDVGLPNPNLFTVSLGGFFGRAAANFKLEVVTWAFPKQVKVGLSKNWRGALRVEWREMRITPNFARNFAMAICDCALKF